MLAEPKYTPKIIPKCEVKDIKSGGKGCVYNLDQVKKLYEIDSELFALRRTSALQEQKIVLQGSVIEKTLEQLRLSQESVQIISERNKELTEQLIETDRKYQYELVKPRWGSPVLWAGIIALAASFAGYVVADQVSK